jgi:hypothetical protein
MPMKQQDHSGFALNYVGQQTEILKRVRTNVRTWRINTLAQTVDSNNHSYYSNEHALTAMYFSARVKETSQHIATEL